MMKENDDRISEWMRPEKVKSRIRENKFAKQDEN